MPEKIGKIRDPRRLKGILCLFFFFFPRGHRDFLRPKLHSSFYSAPGFYHVSTRFLDVTCPMFNEASKVIGTLTIAVFLYQFYKRFL